MSDRHLPPRDCMVLLTGETWVHIRYASSPLPTWADIVSGEAIDLADVVTWREVDDEPGRQELRRRINLAVELLRTIKRTDDNVSALNKAQGQLEEIWEDLGP